MDIFYLFILSPAVEVFIQACGVSLSSGERPLRSIQGNKGAFQDFLIIKGVCFKEVKTSATFIYLLYFAFMLQTVGQKMGKMVRTGQTLPMNERIPKNIK